MPDAIAPNPTERAIFDGLGRIRAALGIAADSWGARIVFVGVGVGYFVLYLVGIGDLWLTGGPGALTVRVAANPLRALAIDGFGRFGAISVVYLGGLGLTYLFSPLNLLVALLIAGLVGANGAITYIGLRQPRGSRLSPLTVGLASIPPLLMGAACIGPTVVYLAGVQNSSAVLTGLGLLVPISAVLFIASILRLSKQLLHHRA